MTRTFLVVSTAVFVAGCTATPTVTKQRMTLGEANISGMECRRETSLLSSIPKTTCASPAVWAKYDKREADKSAQFFDDIHDNADNRILYRNR
jgi:hypothetical protein